jgi:hypothetical protein
MESWRAVESLSRAVETETGATEGRGRSRNGALEAQTGATEGRGCSQWSCGESKWSHGRPWTLAM